MIIVALTPAAWLAALFIALLLLLVPFLFVEVIARSLAEPWRTLTNVTGSFIVIPAAMTLHYRRRLLRSGQGSLTFWVYVALYAGLSVIAVILMYHGRPTADGWLGVVVPAAVAACMLFFAQRARRQAQSRFTRVLEQERVDGAIADRSKRSFS